MPRSKPVKRISVAEAAMWTILELPGILQQSQLLVAIRSTRRQMRTRRVRSRKPAVASTSGTDTTHGLRGDGPQDEGNLVYKVGCTALGWKILRFLPKCATCRLPKASRQMKNERLQIST